MATTIVSNIFALYNDEIGGQAVLNYYGEQHAFDLSPQSWIALIGKASEDRAVTDSDNYEEDQTAVILWLKENNYINLLNSQEREIVRAWQYKVKPRATRQPQRRNPLTGHFTSGDRGQW